MILLIIALLAIALIALVAEVMVVPGFGVAGLLGVGALVGAVTLAFVQLGPSGGVASVAVAIAIAGSTLWLLPRTQLGRDLVLEQRHTHAAARVELQALMGQSGVALTALRPAGAADIGGQRVDVVADGNYIDAGTPVRVIAVEGARVVVDAERASA